MMMMRREWLRGLLVFALLMAGFAFKGVLIAPPPLPAQRWTERVQHAAAPSPACSASSATSGRIRSIPPPTMRSAIGSSPNCGRSAFSRRFTRRWTAAAFPRLRVVSCAACPQRRRDHPGPRAGKHLLINAHYDSTPTGPGASDDGLGVATMLEVAALLKQSPPPGR